MLPMTQKSAILPKFMIFFFKKLKKTQYGLCQNFGCAKMLVRRCLGGQKKFCKLPNLGAKWYKKMGGRSQTWNLSQACKVFGAGVKFYLEDTLFWLRIFLSSCT